MTSTTTSTARRTAGRLAALAVAPVLALGLLGSPAQATSNSHLSADTTSVSVNAAASCNIEAVANGRNVRAKAGFNNKLLYSLNKGAQVKVWKSKWNNPKRVDGHDWVNIRFSNSYDQWTVKSNFKLLGCDNPT